MARSVTSVAGTEDPSRLLDVVFVHGLDGDPLKTWSAGGAAAFWPAWLAADHPSAGVWAVGYEAWSSKWRGHAMPLQDRAVNLMAHLRSVGIGDRPLCLIGHSLGGLIIKQILFHGQVLSDEYGALANQTVGVVFMGTPHGGSGLAQIADALRVVYRPTQAVRDLLDNDAYLRMLGGWYRSNLPKLAVEHLVLYETQRTEGLLVVDQGSADPGLPGITPVPVDANHRSISKPTGREHFVYRQVDGFVRRLLDRAASAQESQPDRWPVHVPFVDQRDADSPAELVAVAGAELRRVGALSSTYQWLLDDQIEISGGWGRAQAQLMQLLTGEAPSELDQREGGIYTTFVVLRAMREYEGSADVFLTRPYVRRATRYLYDRQGRDGGLGRFVRSRSGEQLLRSLRHTAFGVSALLAVAGSPNRIASGLDYLGRELPDYAWDDDASPAEALAATAHLAQQVADEDVAAAIGSRPLLTEDALHELYRELADQSTVTSFAPLWPPYGGHRDMAYETALSAIDLLPRPTPTELKPTVLRVVLSILDEAFDGGVRYAPGFARPDVGLSSSALWTLLSRVLVEPIESTAIKGRLLAVAKQLIDWLVDNWNDPDYRLATYADTVGFILCVAALDGQHHGGPIGLAGPPTDRHLG